MTTPTALAARLAADLADYTEHAVDSLSPAAHRAIAREDGIPVLLEARERTDRLALALRLFLLGDRLDEVELARALPSIEPAEAREAGLLNEGGRAAFALTPVAVPDHHGGGRLLVASDFGALAGRSVGPEFVMPVGGATSTLANIARYRSGERVLDLGTGGGWHAILAARSGARVTATDVSERALAMAEFNAALAGVDLTLVRTSLYEGLDGPFDVIVSNPPFVLTPPAVRSRLGTFTYRDGGPGILETVVRGATERLTPGGRAYILGNWELPLAPEDVEASEEWAVPAEWTGGRDAWVMAREVLDPAEYVSMWMRDTGETDRELEEAWISDFAARGIHSIALGYVMIGAAGRWRRAEIYRGPIDEGFASGDRIWDNRVLESLGDAELGRLVLERGPVTEERSHTPGLADPWRIRLGCAGRETVVSGEVAGFVGACDGTMQVSVILGALAVLLDTSKEELTRAILPSVRRLLADGFLAVAPGPLSTPV